MFSVRTKFETLNAVACESFNCKLNYLLYRKYMVGFKFSSRMRILLTVQVHRSSMLQYHLSLCCPHQDLGRVSSIQVLGQ